MEHNLYSKLEDFESNGSFCVLYSLLTDRWLMDCVALCSPLLVDLQLQTLAPMLLVSQKEVLITVYRSTYVGQGGIRFRLYFSFGQELSILNFNHFQESNWNWTGRLIYWPNKYTTDLAAWILKCYKQGCCHQDIFPKRLQQFILFYIVLSIR